MGWVYELDQTLLHESLATETTNDQLNITEL